MSKQKAKKPLKKLTLKQIGESFDDGQKCPCCGSVTSAVEDEVGCDCGFWVELEIQDGVLGIGAYEGFELVTEQKEN